MCALNSPTDAIEPPLTAYDLAQACGDVMKALAAHLDAATRIGVDNETRAAFRARGVRPEKATESLDCALVAYFAICRNAAGETFGTAATIYDVAKSWDGRLDQNDRDINRTAMRRADTAEAADVALTAGQRALGASLLDTLPAYGTTETAPCADLTRAAETHDYGKSAAASASFAHGAYERGFGSISAA